MFGLFNANVRVRQPLTFARHNDAIRQPTRVCSRFARGLILKESKFIGGPSRLNNARSNFPECLLLPSAPISRPKRVRRSEHRDGSSDQDNSKSSKYEPLLHGWKLAASFWNLSPLFCSLFILVSI